MTSTVLEGSGRREAGGGVFGFSLGRVDERSVKAYANPYVAGVGLGLVLLAAFVVMGRGLGATGAFANAAAEIVTTVSPSRAQSSHYFARYLNSDGGGRIDWLVVGLVGGGGGGVAVGGFCGRAGRG